MGTKRQTDTRTSGNRPRGSHVNCVAHTRLCGDAAGKHSTSKGPAGGGGVGTLICLQPVPRVHMSLPALRASERSGAAPCDVWPRGLSVWWEAVHESQ